MKSNMSYWCESNGNKLWLPVITRTEIHVIQRHLKLNSNVLLTRRSSLSPLLIKTPTRSYRLGTWGVVGQPYSYVPCRAEDRIRPCVWTSDGSNLHPGDTEHGYDTQQQPGPSDVAVAAVSLAPDEAWSSTERRHERLKLALWWLPGSVSLFQLPCSSPQLDAFSEARRRHTLTLLCVPRDGPGSPSRTPLEATLPQPGIPLRAGGISRPLVEHGSLHSSSRSLCADTEHLTHSARRTAPRGFYSAR